MTTPENLSEQGKLAYQSFLDMTQSKDQHFSFLADLETKYESGGAPSDDENQELQQLLDVHDKNVKAFKTAFSALTDAAEKQAVIALMS